MSRDFLVECADEAQAREAEIVLSLMCIEPGRQRLFGEVDNRGTSVFATLTHAGAVDATHRVVLDGHPTPLAPEVALVALKNGMHQSLGLAFFSPALSHWAPADGAHLAHLHGTIGHYFGLAAASGRLRPSAALYPSIEPTVAA